MLHQLKKMVEGITPPMLMNILRSKYGSYGFSGDYSSWEEAKKHSKGYDAEGILNKVKESLLKVKNGEAAYERDSVLFDKIEYSWPLLSALLWASSRRENRLNLIDFGGSLGSSYYQNRFFLSHLNEFKWNIVEQKHFVECGKRFFEDDHLNFHYSISECKLLQGADVILFLSVIQYIENPYILLQEVVDLKFQVVIFDRTTFWKKGRARIATQRVSSKINEASYPLWFFNEEEFVDFFHTRGYEVVAQFDSVHNGGIACPEFKGFVFNRVTK